MLFKEIFDLQSKWEIAGVCLWTLAVGAYFFQFPFPILSSILTPALFLYIITQIPKLQILKDKKYIILLIAYFLYLAFAAVRSVMLDVSLLRVIRFFVILAAIPIVFCLHDKNFSIKKDIFIILATVKAILLIFFAVLIMYYGDYSFFRSWANEFHLGDIYFLKRFFPKVQVHGNALLVVAFMLDFEERKKLTIRNVILLLGVLCAGNFAFLLAIVAYVGWKFLIFAIDYCKKHPRAKWGLVAVICVAVIAMIPFIYAKVIEKSEVSNAVRLDQLKILSNTNFWIGNGLGSWVEAQTPLVQYDGNIYFEMQTLYIFNQVGIIGCALFYWVTLFSMYAAGNRRFILYLIYLLFSFWNPYCFDVTQIITILLITNMSELGAYHDKSTYYRLQSLCRRSQ